MEREVKNVPTTFLATVLLFVTSFLTVTARKCQMEFVELWFLSIHMDVQKISAKFNFLPGKESNEGFEKNEFRNT